MTGYTTGTGNQTTNDGTWTYSYDAEGNLSKKSKGASLETWNYSYDQQNHLVSVEKHATDGGTLQLKVQYKYDALDNRIERTEDSDGDGNVDATERFGYDGGNVWADLNTNNNITYRRLFGPGVDEPVARITAAGTVVWYLTDYQHSVIDMVNSTGSSLGSLTYDGFGNILTNTTGVNGDRYGFTSRERDSATGLQYNWARYYDPALGKWTSMDPLGFDAGDANLYRYVENGPTNAVDPSGFDSITAPYVPPPPPPPPPHRPGVDRPDNVIYCQEADSNMAIPNGALLLYTTNCAFGNATWLSLTGSTDFTIQTGIYDWSGVADAVSHQTNLPALCLAGHGGFAGGVSCVPANHPQQNLNLSFETLAAHPYGALIIQMINQHLAPGAPIILLSCGCASSDAWDELANLASLLGHPIIANAGPVNWGNHGQGAWFLACPDPNAVLPKPQQNIPPQAGPWRPQNPLELGPIDY